MDWTREFDETFGLPPPDDRDTAMLDAEPELSRLDELTRHWMNERHCPDILPIQDELLNVLLDHIKSQSQIVQDIQAEKPADARTSDTSHDQELHVQLMLVQIEIERVKFIVRSYIRTRLFKIEKYARHITQSEDLQRRITQSERDYASRHVNLTDRHYFSSVLQSLPPVQATLDETPDIMPSIVSQPDKTKPVFVHALRECGEVVLPDNKKLKMEKGRISLLPYYVIENLLLADDVELV